MHAIPKGSLHSMAGIGRGVGEDARLQLSQHGKYKHSQDSMHDRP